MAQCRDVLADKMHPRFLGKKIEEKGVAYSPVFTLKPRIPKCAGFRRKKIRHLQCH